MTLLHLNSHQVCGFSGAASQQRCCPKKGGKQSSLKPVMSWIFAENPVGSIKARVWTCVHWEERRVKVTEQLWSPKNVHVLNSSAWNRSSFSDFIVDKVTLQRGILSLQETSWSYNSPSPFFLTYKGCLEPEHMKRESYLQHVTLNQRIEMPWVWEHRPCTDRRKSVFGERWIKTPVPPPSGWGSAWLGVTFLLPSVLFQSHLLPVAISLS